MANLMQLTVWEDGMADEGPHSDASLSSASSDDSKRKGKSKKGGKSKKSARGSKSGRKPKDRAIPENTNTMPARYSTWKKTPAMTPACFLSHMFSAKCYSNSTVRPRSVT